MDWHTEPHWENSALITIDMQNDFADDGAFPVTGTTAVVPRLRQLVDAYRAQARPIFHALRIYLPDGTNADRVRRAALGQGTRIVIPGSAGAQLVNGLLETPVDLETKALLASQPQQIGPAEHLLYKPRWNAFYDTQLLTLLSKKEVDTVVLGGCNYPNCPRATAFGASERDLRVVMASDALSGFDERSAPEMDRIGVHSMDVGQIVACLRVNDPRPAD
jgi:nicotinamidase-related amidase